MSENKQEEGLSFKGCHFKLDWVGKQSPEKVEQYPVEFVQKSGSATRPENFDFQELNKNWSNLLFHGDNKEVLHALLSNGFRGKIDLIYIDPPFDSKADYVKKLELKGDKGMVLSGGQQPVNVELFKNEQQSLAEQTQYTDLWKGSEYLQFMYERLILLRELLSDRGSIYLHCDWHKSHHLRFLLDEVFGEDNFGNEIIWRYTSSRPPTKDFARKHDTVMRYYKTEARIFHEITKKSSNEGKYNLEDEQGKYKIVRGYKKYFKEDVPIDDTWDIPLENVMSLNNLNYPTQKPEALLERIIKASSNPNSIVLDCFAGSGTTQAVAEKLGRRWIGADINKVSTQTTIKRINKIWNDNPMEKRYGLLHYKVGSYDFQDEQNLIAMAIEFYSLRKKTHAFFDYEKGEIPVKTFLKDKNGVFSLAHFTQVQNYLIENDIQTDTYPNPNFIYVIVNGITHEAREKIEFHNAKTSYARIYILNVQESGMKADKEPEASLSMKDGVLKIENYISHMIFNLFQKANRLNKFEIKDFRSMIDYVLIDTNYNGQDFNIVASDIPKNKKALIEGTYNLGECNNIAIKVVSILGEESLFVLK